MKNYVKKPDEKDEGCFILIRPVLIIYLFEKKVKKEVVNVWQFHVISVLLLTTLGFLDKLMLWPNSESLSAKIKS